MHIFCRYFNDISRELFLTAICRSRTRVVATSDGDCPPAAAVRLRFAIVYKPAIDTFYLPK